MMYPYIALSDGTEIIHSHLMGEGEEKTVEVHFERPKPYGFDSARCSLPSYEWIIRDGFTDDEIAVFERMLKDNVHLLYKYAETGGISFSY